MGRKHQKKQPTSKKHGEKTMDNYQNKERHYAFGFLVGDY